MIANDRDWDNVLDCEVGASFVISATFFFSSFFFFSASFNHVPPSPSNPSIGVFIDDRKSGSNGIVYLYSLSFCLYFESEGPQRSSFLMCLRYASLNCFSSVCLSIFGN